MPQKAELLLDAKAGVGECPIWCPRANGLYFVDIMAPALYFLDPSSGALKSWPMPEPIGCFALTEGREILVALRRECRLLDPDTGALRPFAPVETDRPHNRLNDGRCDRAGRLWVGSMREPQDPNGATGRLYSLSPDGRAVAHVEGIHTSNGLAFSPDDRTAYFSDSFPAVRTIWAFDFDLAEGRLSNRRVFVDTHGMPGRPDGGCVDSEGCYWSAANDGWEVVRYTPAGEVDRRIALPVSKPGMPAFGGADLKTLFVTSLRTPGLDLAREPLAGGVFAIRLDVAGLPEPRFGARA